MRRVFAEGTGRSAVQAWSLSSYFCSAGDLLVEEMFNDANVCGRQLGSKILKLELRAWDSLMVQVAALKPKCLAVDPLALLALTLIPSSQTALQDSYPYSVSRYFLLPTMVVAICVVRE